MCQFIIKIKCKKLNIINKYFTSKCVNKSTVKLNHSSLTDNFSFNLNLLIIEIISGMFSYVKFYLLFNLKYIKLI